MTDLNKYILADRKPMDDYPMVEPIVCKDGFSLSVQASSGHYSSPRDNFGPYSAVEVGYPSEEPEFIMEYCENKYNPTNTVYGYVPIELVEQLIDLHGGIAQGKDAKGFRPYESNEPRMASFLGWEFNKVEG